jgi:hypothetical protein
MFYMCKPGHPDTERFKLLKSVSNQSHSCLEDERKILRSYWHIAGTDTGGCEFEILSSFTDIWSPAIVNYFLPSGKK